MNITHPITALPLPLPIPPQRPAGDAGDRPTMPATIADRLRELIAGYGALAPAPP